ncbi:unnamed protein product [Cladocopium goreaui]|uniref:Uncharacterized protein n=1 Tax=Cladocopium goreaui TaxID=2562237 RepID=A0A9P1BVI0_9DINO|nr:unnamed protein product [Cladocopium goreaui]
MTSMSSPTHDDVVVDEPVSETSWKEYTFPVADDDGTCAWPGDALDSSGSTSPTPCETVPPIENQKTVVRLEIDPAAKKRRITLILDPEEK